MGTLHAQCRFRTFGTGIPLRACTKPSAVQESRSHGSSYRTERLTYYHMPSLRRAISVCVTCGPYKSAGRFRRVGRSDPDLQTSDQQPSLAHTLVATFCWMLLLPLAAACSLLVSSRRPAAYHHQHAPQQACVAAVCQRHHQRSADTPAVSSPYKQHAFASISFAHALGHAQRAYIAQTFVYQVQRVRPVALTRLPLLS